MISQEQTANSWSELTLRWLCVVKCCLLHDKNSPTVNCGIQRTVYKKVKFFKVTYERALEYIVLFGLRVKASFYQKIARFASLLLLNLQKLAGYNKI